METNASPICEIKDLLFIDKENLKGHVNACNLSMVLHYSCGLMYDGAHENIFTYSNTRVLI